MTVADYIVRYLAARGVSHVFAVSGGMICPLLDAITRQSTVKVVSTCHEQAAGFAAEGWARMTGIPGVAMATSGPGATNLLTAVASCYFDSTPAVFITGQVRRDELRAGRGGRQRGFQETDICAMAMPVTKAVWQVHSPSSTPRVIDDAFALAARGRPGPVLIDLPFDVQMEDIGEPAVEVVPDALTPHGGCFPPGRALVETALGVFQTMARPLVLLGGGARCPSLLPFLAWLGAPVVHSLMAVDLLHYDHAFRVGMIGSYGNRWANWAVMRSDALLVLGSRLDVRQTGSRVDAFAARSIIHVDVDHSEIGNRVPPSFAFNTCVEDFCRVALSLKQEDQLIVRGEWGRAIFGKSNEWSDFRENKVDPPFINPNAFLYELSRARRDAAAFVVDVGQHQMWAAQSMALARGQRFLTSGGHGAMGSALPMAIGAAFASKRPIVCVVGDGGLQVSLAELHTVRRYDLPIYIVVANNRSHGMVRQFQDEVFEGRRVATMEPPPNFGNVARAFNLPAWRFYHRSDCEHTMHGLQPPVLVEVELLTTIDANPKTRFGCPLDEMSPPR